MRHQTPAEFQRLMREHDRLRRRHRRICYHMDRLQSLHLSARWPCGARRVLATFEEYRRLRDAVFYQASEVSHAANTLFMETMTRWNR